MNGTSLRYVQRTYAYLRPDETDRWMNLLNRLTMWIAIGILGVLVYVMLIAKPGPAFFSGLYVVAPVAIVVLGAVYWVCLCRLWVLLRGEGQISGDF